MAEQQPLVGDRTFRSDVVRVAALTVNTDTIEGYEFSNCRIIGPAILVLLSDVQISYSRWDAPSFDAVFWEVPPDRGPVVGVVGVKKCRFSNCVFENIGIAGPPDMRPILEKGITEGS